MNVTIPDAGFQKERILINGWKLNSREELLYHRIFKEHFGEFENLDWMGRTIVIPIVQEEENFDHTD